MRRRRTSTGDPEALGGPAGARNLVVVVLDGLLGAEQVDAGAPDRQAAELEERMRLLGYL